MRRPSRPTSRLRRLGAVAVALAVLVAGVALGQADARESQAAPAALLDGFDPADIISDAVMWNADTMSAAEIQAFLDRQQPSCTTGATCLKAQRIDIQAMAANPMCRALPGAQDQTVAQVIKKVATACSVNPQVMLVMLQKEQTLITGRRPYSSESVALIYRKATGLGCPDTAPCDPAKYGLFNQLYGVAYWLVRYTMPAGTGPGTAYSSVYNWFPIGRPNGVLYNPNAACGAATITIRNKATAALYYYTPYQPNAAALAAGWGTGNSCSAYGNRNFYLYFTSWFGSTHQSIVVTGAIETLWKKMSAEKGLLGEPAANAESLKDGQRQRFVGGTVYSSSAGTFAMTGPVGKKYEQLGGGTGVLGFPKTGVLTRTPNGGGKVTGFAGGTIFSSSAGTFYVTGAIHSRYAKAKAEAGSLGYPTSDPATSTAGGGGTQQSFRGGRITSAGGATVTLTGKALEMWIRRGAENSTMRWPAAEPETKTVNKVKGTVQGFQNGSVYALPTKTYTVTGDIWRNYRSHGGYTGAYGWPRAVSTQSTANGGGWSQRFEKATIYSNPTAGTHPLTGKILALYNQRGGTKGTLGWPATKVKESGGYIQPFTNGKIYQSKAGTVAVLGDILKRYEAKKGPGGTLGWPTTTATVSKGVTTQRFERGVIRWTKAGGAKASRK